MRLQPEKVRDHIIWVVKTSWQVVVYEGVDHQVHGRRMHYVRHPFVQQVALNVPADGRFWKALNRNER